MQGFALQGVIGLVILAAYVRRLLADPFREGLGFPLNLILVLVILSFGVGFRWGESRTAVLGKAMLAIACLALVVSPLLLASGGWSIVTVFIYGYSWAWIPALCSFVTIGFFGCFTLLAIGRLSSATR